VRWKLLNKQLGIRMLNSRILYLISTVVSMLINNLTSDLVLMTMG